MSAPGRFTGVFGSARYFAFRALAPPLGLGLVFAGGSKVQSAGHLAERFGTWGLHPDLIPWTGAVEIVLGLGLFFVGTRVIAAGVATLWMTGGVIVHLIAGQLGIAGLTATLGALAGMIAVSGLRAGLHRSPTLPAPLRDPPTRPAEQVRFLFALVGVSFLVRWAIGGILFWASLPILGLMHSHAEGNESSRDRVGNVLLYLLVLGVGVAGLWGFVGHLFMADEVARSTGWAAGSPFQSELAFYHLAMGAVALMCIWVRDRYWMAAGLTPAIFALGAGAVHVRDFLHRGNTAPANWGLDVVVGNFLIPLVLISTLVAYARLDGWERARRREHLSE